MGRLFAKFAIGGIAGILAWLLLLPTEPKSMASYAASSWEAWFVLAMGAFIGLAVGGLDGFTRGGKQHTLIGLGLGLFLGAIGMMFGHGIGETMARAIFGATIFTATNNILETIPARVVAFIPMGLCLGAAIGASSLTTKRIIQGAIGGAIGAAIAGVLFDPLGSFVGTTYLTLRGQSSGEVGTTGRAVFALLLGAGIGLFIGLVERFSRSAWLRLSLGRNEGKEWSIDSVQTFIGRSEGASVPLFGDPNVAPLHASIQRQGANYVLTDGGSPMGTFLNGQRIQQAMLGHGAQIQIGGFVLQFLMKNQPAPAMGPEAYRGQAYPMQGSPQPGGPAPAGYPPAGYPQPAQPVGAAPAPYNPYAPQAPMPQSGPYGGQPTQVMPQAPYPSPASPYGGQPTQTFPGQGMHASQPTMAYGGGFGGYALLALDGPVAGQRFPVGGPVEIGREGAGVRLGQDPNASRRHAAVSPGVGGVAVQDLGSTNGTFVNGQRVSQASAGPGDLIKVGSTTFRVEAA